MFQLRSVGGDRRRSRRMNYLEQGLPGPVFETCEPRLLLTTYVVTTAADSGAGSLREAIDLANASFGADTITFNIGADTDGIAPGFQGAPTVITLTSAALNQITEELHIDGYSQGGPGYSGAPLIEITRSGAFSGTGLIVNGHNSSVQGVSVTGFAAFGIFVGADNTVIQNNYVGLQLDGSTIKGNGSGGIRIDGSAAVVGGNGGDDNQILNNVVSGNGNDGISVGHIGANDALNALIQGNYVGTDATGMLDRGNSLQGINIESGNNRGAQVLDNVVSGNGGIGIANGSIGAPATIIQGNYVGVAADGVTALGNTGNGVALSESTVLGGLGVGEGNLIAFNTGVDGGVVITAGTGYSVRGNTIRNNTNQGILFSNPVNFSTIIEQNTITGNGTRGIRVVTGTNVTIINNSIHSNGALGIDLFVIGITPNDVGDGDGNGNNQQNFPILVSASTNTGGTVTNVKGSINTVASSNVTLEFFASPTLDPSGNGEGAIFLGSALVVTDGSGDFDFSGAGINVAGAPVGYFITATATLAANTSEFSNGVAILNNAPTANAGPDTSVAEGGSVILSAAGSSDPNQSTATLTYAWDFDGDTFFDDATGISPTFSAAALDGFVGSTVTVSVLVTDTQGLNSVDSAVITINNVNPNLTVTNAIVTVNEGTTATNTGTFSDVVGDNVTITASEGVIVQDPGNSGNWSWSKGTSDNEATHTVTVFANDGDGGISSVTFDLTVNNVNPTVVVDNAAVTVNEGTLATNTGSFADLGLGDIVTITASEGAIVQTNGASGTWSWSKATNDDEATHIVTITATDDNGGTASVTFNLTVDNVDPTVAVDSAAVTVNEGTLATNTGSFADLGLGDVVTITASEGAIVQTNGASGTWSWSKATNDDEATHIVTITATDDNGGTASVTFNLTVDNVDPTVAVNNAAVTVNEGTTATNTGSFADLGLGDIVTITASEGTIIQTNGASGTWSWSKATSDDEAAHLVTITATDDNGGTASVTFNLTVNNVDPTVAVDNAAVSVTEGATAVNSGSFADLGLGDIVTITASEGTIVQTVGSSGTWTWSKNTVGPEATHTVTITATDDDGGTASITFDLTVTPGVGTAFVAADTANPGDTALFVVGTNDNDIIELTKPSDGNVQVRIRNRDTLALIYQDTFATAGIDRFVITGLDGNDLISVASNLPSTIQAEIYGNDGNDLISGGSGNDYIDGGDGVDVIFGANGRDILVGGLGFDVVTGNVHDDILIGGVYTGGRETLAYLFAEWASDTNYNSRVNNLKNGGGLNGSYVLNQTTVFDDNVADILLGLQGRDWFLSDLEDDITDKAVNEVLTDIEIDFFGL